jgi:hypothetical protein
MVLVVLEVGVVLEVVLALVEVVQVLALVDLALVQLLDQLLALVQLLSLVAQAGLRQAWVVLRRAVWELACLRPLLHPEHRNTDILYA